MALTPEERKKIYEEEKARIEVREQIERERGRTSGATSTGLKPNVAALLCYAGWWITGIIFFVLEQKNSWVRFHAAQSILVFGTISVTGLVLGWIPFIGTPMATIVTFIGFIFWIILMLKAYHGEKYKVGWAGEIAETMVSSASKTYEYNGPVETPTSAASDSAAIAAAVKEAGETVKNKTETFFRGSREGRITASAFVIAWDIVLIFFFNFFYKLAAFYQESPTGNSWIQYPFFTERIHLWLPIVTTALIISILGNVVLIIYDRYILRQLIRIVIDAFAFVAVTSLLTIFPFDFHVIPNTVVAGSLPFGISVILIIISIGIVIGILVRAIKLIINVLRGTVSYEVPS
jgi:uncharacterized membrane protein